MKVVINKWIISWAAAPGLAGLSVGLVLLTVGTAASIAASKHQGTITVGMIPLLASPQKYDGKVIRTIGFLHIGTQPEDDSLWLHEEDGQFALYKNSFELSLSDDQRKQFMHLNHTYVSIEGTLRSNGPEGINLYSGVIVHITAMDGWYPYRPSLPAPTK